jgi:hypothetical protein
MDGSIDAPITEIDRSMTNSRPGVGTVKPPCTSGDGGSMDVPHRCGSDASLGCCMVHKYRVSISDDVQFALMPTHCITAVAKPVAVKRRFCHPRRNYV